MKLPRTLIGLLWAKLLIREYKWLIKWHEVRRDSWTDAMKSGGKTGVGDRLTEIQIWADRYNYHTSSIDGLASKIENL